MRAFPPDVRSPWSRYGTAVLAVVAAFVVTRLDSGLDEHAPFLLLIAGIVVTALVAGLGPAFAAAALATAAAGSILAESGSFPDEADGKAILLFVIVSVGLAWLVSNRRASLAALEASETRYRKLVDMLPDAVFVNRGSRWVFANRAAVALLGASDASEIVGRSIFDFIVPEEQQVVEARQRITRGGGQTPLRSGTLVRVDGTQVKAEVTATSIGAPGNDDILVAMRDVTARVTAEHERIRTAAALQAVIDAAPIAVVTLDKDAIVRTWNKAAETTFGWRADEAIGRRYPLVGEQDETSFAATFSAALEGRAITLNTQRQRKDGTALDVMIATAPIMDAQGRFEHVVALLMDMTEQRRLEEQFRQAQKLEAIGRLAGGVAHDFNNLLTAILGFSELAADNLPADSSAREDIKQIARAGETAKSLTRQLLAFSRKQIMRPALLDVCEHVRNSERFLARVIGEDVKVALDLAPVPAVVRADPAQLDQVIMNLAVNARDAMPDGGLLTLRVRPVTLDRGSRSEKVDVQPGDYVLLAIADTGLGMTAEVQQRVFEPFFTTKPQGKGTGLGLATVYGIVKQSGGYIWVESEPGSGTTVKVYLPAIAAALPAVVSEPAARDESGSETVLIVDDTPVIAELARRMLRGQGYTVLVAHSPGEALALADKHDRPIDVLVTDVVMPDLSGTELADALRLRRPEMRVLYMSGYADSDLLRNALADPDGALLEKPFTAGKLIERIRELLSDTSHAR